MTQLARGNLMNSIENKAANINISLTSPAIAIVKNKRQRIYSTEIFNTKRSVLEHMEVTPQEKFPRSIELEEDSTTRLSSPNYHFALHVDTKFPN